MLCDRWQIQRGRGRNRKEERARSSSLKKSRGPSCAPLSPFQYKSRPPKGSWHEWHLNSLFRAPSFRMATSLLDRTESPNLDLIDMIADSTFESRQPFLTPLFGLPASYVRNNNGVLKPPPICWQSATQVAIGAPVSSPSAASAAL